MRINASYGFPTFGVYGNGSSTDSGASSSNESGSSSGGAGASSGGGGTYSGGATASIANDPGAGMGGNR